MYISVVNPVILSQAGLPFSGVLTATGLLSFGCSFLMGLYSQNPLYFRADSVLLERTQQAAKQVDFEAIPATNRPPPTLIVGYRTRATYLCLRKRK
jgi:hypothetical protein